MKTDYKKFKLKETKVISIREVAYGIGTFISEF